MLVTQLLAPTAVSHAVQGCFTGSSAQVVLGKHNPLELWEGAHYDPPGAPALRQILFGNLVQLAAFRLPPDAHDKHSFLVGHARAPCHAVCCGRLA